jgi:hypothetical protein
MTTRAGNFRERISSPGPKKMLAIDGGGIRGLIAIEFLAKIERELRAAYGNPSLVLADYFDYVAGSSTGAILGTMVSLGMDIDAMREFYVTRAKDMFAPASLIKRLLQNKYLAARLQELIREVLGDETLGSEKLRTLLLLVMRNATTDSPWPISNNPNAKYNDTALDNCNLNLPLWQLVRASAAAPVYFPAEVIDVGPERFIFVDGAVTMYNNPAFLLFLMATLEPYKLNWPAGEENLLLISVGTGLSRRVNANLKTEHMHVLYHANSVPSALIYSALTEQDKLCRIFGRLCAGTIWDSEIGDLMGPGLVSPKLFTYMRYNVPLSRKELDKLKLHDITESDVQPLDRIDRMPQLQRVGSAAADTLVDIKHFAGFLG